MVESTLLRLASFPRTEYGKWWRVGEIMIGHKFTFPSLPSTRLGIASCIEIDPWITTRKEFTRATNFSLLDLYTSGVFQLYHYFQPFFCFFFSLPPETSQPRPDKSTSTMRVAVLINTPPGNEFWQDVRQAWHDALTTAAPQAQVNFYDTVHEAKFPDPRDYNLIVLSGGKADASSSEPWVLGVLDYVRKTARESPKTKILGICWGHQAVSRALGGEVQAVPTGPIVLNSSGPESVLNCWRLCWLCAIQ